MVLSQNYLNKKYQYRITLIKVFLFLMSFTFIIRFKYNFIVLRRN